MKFKTLSGKIQTKNIKKYLIDWDGKSRSKFQFTVKTFLKEYWEKHICYEELVLAGTKLSLDLVNLTRRIAVECHGKQHNEYVPFFHNKNKMNFLEQCERDSKKKEWCEINDITLVEIYEKDLKNLSKEWIEETYEIVF